MQTKTKVVVKVGEDNTITLSVHPQMTARELQQLIQASVCLYDNLGSSTSKCQAPAFVLTRQRNLLIDYLLTSTSCPLSKICKTYNKSSSLLTSYHKANLHLQSPQNQISTNQNQKTDILQLDILLTINPKENQTSYFNYHPAKNRKVTLTEQNDQQKLKFQSLVTLKNKEEGFCEQIMVSKQSLKSYGQFQKLMKIRQKMIIQTKNHSNIFKDLLMSSQDKEYLIFWFSYSPAIKVIEMMRHHLVYQSKKVLIDKIISFIIYLASEGFEKYIRELISLQKVHLLLDSIMIDISQNMYLADLNLILQKDERQSHKVAKDQWKTIQRHIYKYFLAQIHQEKTGYSKHTSFEDIFSMKFHKFKVETRENHRSESSYFNWSAKSLNAQQSIDRNQGTTVKKKLVKEDLSKKRGKSQKTKVKQFNQYSLPYRKQKKSNKKKNKSFA